MPSQYQPNLQEVPKVEELVMGCGKRRLKDLMTCVVGSSSTTATQDTGVHASSMVTSRALSICTAMAGQHCEKGLESDVFS